MPLIVKTPMNPRAIAECGTYSQRLNMLNRRETAVQRQLRRAGLAGYEPVTQATLLALMQRAPRRAAFFDIGSHIGLYSALVDTVFANRGARVFAFEPTPATANISRRLRQYNDLHFEVIQEALSAQPGTATLYLSDKAETSNSLNPDYRAHIGAVPVTVSTLDAFTARRRIDPSVIKIDVETNEPQVLAGGVGTIARARPAIICEVLGAADAVGLTPHVRMLDGLGYRSYPLTRSVPWKAVPPYEIGRLPADAECRDWLFLPRPLTRRLARDVRAWINAIDECDESTNLMVPAGEAPPAYWNAAHPIPAPRFRDRWLIGR
jgi:FkbM family methyltransferase